MSNKKEVPQFKGTLEMLDDMFSGFRAAHDPQVQSLIETEAKQRQVELETFSKMWDIFQLLEDSDMTEIQAVWEALLTHHGIDIPEHFTERLQIGEDNYYLGFIDEANSMYISSEERFLAICKYCFYEVEAIAQEYQDSF